MHIIGKIAHEHTRNHPTSEIFKTEAVKSLVILVVLISAIGRASDFQYFYQKAERLWRQCHIFINHEAQNEHLH